MRYTQLTICPCCGFKFEGKLIDGCEQCGARAVGEPLPRPAKELPAYGRSLALVVAGSATVLVFLSQTVIAMVQKYSGSFGFWTWVAAGETAAWRLKWISIPFLFSILWFGRKIYKSIQLQPERFCGVKHARRGLLASATIALLIALLLGITVPARLRQREMAIEAKNTATGLIIDRALFEYKLKHKTYPDQGDVKAQLATLQDPDGSIAAALRELDSDGYQPRAEVASVGGPRTRGLRGAIIQKASLTSTDDTTPGGLTYSSYELLLPGEDKILGTDDDLVSRDGVISRVKNVAKGGVGRSVSAGALQP